MKIFAILLAVSYISSAYGFSNIGRANVEISDSKFQCDKMLCPSSAERCVVTKEKDPKNPRVLVRTNTCLSRTGVELRKKTWQEGTNPNAKVSVHIEGLRYVGYTPYKPAANGKPAKPGNPAKTKPQKPNSNWNLPDSNDDDNDAFNRAVDELAKDFDF
ncbi:uncharacterized LOC106083545 precursor [Stomoxys calcitrans]|uniref:Putative 15.6 kDa secreted salivary gland protein n=1 Tax=Stomoxys calcitrans TaxID=35570 RepID=A5WXR8_STOCA|nr:uncharacterized LOC106083545 precursor [Stomoxys calcitrans]AAY34546.1 putative 15.6 kDa secreted salivary gland protein [Stomoxys calcitrans]